VTEKRRFGNGREDEIISGPVKDKLQLGKIPIMVKSKFCSLKGP